jgi:hypothetical protein
MVNWLNAMRAAKAPYIPGVMLSWTVIVGSDSPWAVESFSCGPVYFIRDSPYKTKQGGHENDFTAHG